MLQEGWDAAGPRRLAIAVDDMEAGRRGSDEFKKDGEDNEGGWWVGASAGRGGRRVEASVIGLPAALPKG